MIMHLSISPHFPSPFLDTGPLEKSFWWESLFSSDKTTELIILKQKTKKKNKKNKNNHKVAKALLSHLDILC